MHPDSPLSVVCATEAPPWLGPVIVAGFLIVFPLFWCGVLLLLSNTGGWARLAQHYRATAPGPESLRHSLIYARVGWVSYNRVLKFSPAADGFYLEPIILFRPGHPRLFIPWPAVSAQRKARALFGSWVQLEIGTPRIAVITLPRKVLEGTPAGGEA